MSTATLPAKLLAGLPLDMGFGGKGGLTPILKVWIVDDNEFIRSHVGSLLRQKAGIACDRQFTSPVSLLNTLTKEPGPDVILLDVQMGAHNGLDAIRPIKDLSPSTRVYMFSTCFDTHWRYQAFTAGATDYLLKSYAINKIVDRLRNPVRPPDNFWQDRVTTTTAPKPMTDSKTARLRRRIAKGMRSFWNFFFTNAALKREG